MSVIGATIIQGRYQIAGRIASGGMGEVYRAHDSVLGREVAIKVLHPQYANDPGFVDRFRREARAAAVLNHPNVVGVYDWGVTEGTYFMVMEYVQGHNLRTLLSRAGRLEPAQVVEIVSQVLAALDHAHGHGIVHRDIKPENILIAEDGTVKVADFGLARAFADAHVSQAEGTVTGTVQYLAPEQIQGEPADPRTDLYAVGVVMFELLTGSPPYSGETSVAIAYQHLSERVPAPSIALPVALDSLDEVVLHATEKERERRPASARAMRQELARATVGMPEAPRVREIAREIPAAELARAPRAPTVTIPRAVSRKARRRRRLIRSLITLLVLIGLGVGSWATWVYAIPHYTVVPRNLQGVTRAQAQAKLEAAGLKVTLGEPQPSTTVANHLLLLTRPPAGSKVRKGSTVTIVLSSGPRVLAVPSVVGLSSADALAKLRDAGFKPTKELAFNDSVAAGLVISQDPKVGVNVAEGTPVTIVVSRGPKPVTLIDYTGQPEAAVRAALQALGLSVGPTTHENSATVPAGEVIRTEPPAGTTVHRGDIVSIVVSDGPLTFAMPGVVGLTTQQAIAELDGRGLKVRVVVLPSTQGDTVVYQDPAAGTIVQQGQHVTIYVQGK